MLQCLLAGHGLATDARLVCCVVLGLAFKVQGPSAIM